MWTVISGVTTEVPEGIVTPFENVKGWTAIRVRESTCQYMLHGYVVKREWRQRREGRH
jgi:hypothetical protein